MKLALCLALAFAVCYTLRVYIQQAVGDVAVLVIVLSAGGAFLIVAVGVVLDVWRWWEGLSWRRSERKRKAESCGVEPR